MNDELNTLNKSIEEANRLTQSVGASRDVNLQPLGTITSESLAGSATPIQLPDAPTPQYRPSPIVPPPSGTTFDSKAGIANTPPPTEKPGGMDWIKKQFAKLGGDLGQKAEFTKQEQEEAQLAQKREKQAQSYNAYQQAQLDLNRQIESLAGSGLTDVQRAAQEKEYRRVGNANIANLAIQAQADQNLLGAAEQTIKDKVDAQFSPIQDQIDWLTKFSTITSNDLTESESAILNSKIRQQETDYTNVTKTADELQQAMLQNGAPQTVYSAIDKISNDYVAGKIDAQTAQSRMRQAAGSYGTKKEKVTGDGAPTIKSINGVDMQWNPTTSKWETINTTDGNVDSLVAERGADKIIQLDSLINNTTGIKANAGLWRRTGLINKQVANDWSADAINVLSRLTVDELGRVKADGVTFGALSDPERKAVGDAASALNAGMVMENGVPTGKFKLSEDKVRKEFETIMKYAKLDFEKRTGMTYDQYQAIQSLAPDDFSEVDSIYGDVAEFNPANYYK